MVIIHASAASMLRCRLRESGEAKPPEFFLSSSDQTDPEKQAGRRFTCIFTDSFNKFSRLTLKKWDNKN